MRKTPTTDAVSRVHRVVERVVNQPYGEEQRELRENGERDEGAFNPRYEECPAGQQSGANNGR